MSVHQKLGMILGNKAVQKLKLAKNVLAKNGILKPIFEIPQPYWYYSIYTAVRFPKLRNAQAWIAHLRISVKKNTVKL